MTLEHSSTEQTTQPAEDTTQAVVAEATQTESVSNESTETTSESTADNTAESSADNDDDDTKKSGKGFEKRIERFNRRLAEKEAEVEHWRKAALAQNGNQAQPIPTVPQPQLDKPKFADFNDLDAYTDAMTDWKLAQREVVQKQQAMQSTYAQKEAALRAKADDYDEVVSDFKSKYRHVNAPEVNQYIAESDVGPELFYHLANNHSETDRILSLSPIKRIAELGKLEAKLSQTESNPPVVNKISKAPKPVTKETGTAPAVKRIEDPNISQSEYRQLRMANRRRY